MPCEPPCRHWTHYSSRKPLPVREPLRLPKNEITPTIRDTESHPSCPAWAGGSNPYHNPPFLVFTYAIKYQETPFIANKRRFSPQNSIFVLDIKGR